MILCDTDVLIEYLKGNRRVKEEFDNLGVDILAISAISLMEVYYGALNKRELITIKRALKNFTIIPLNEDITDIAIGLIEKYSKSYGLKIPDALIAATSIYASVPLWTFNKKDFKYIKNIKLM